MIITCAAAIVSSITMLLIVRRVAGRSFFYQGKRVSELPPIIARNPTAKPMPAEDVQP